MDQARSKITKIFNGEPHSYTRFNLTQNMEGDNSQVEMKLSSDMEEGVGENGVGNHLNHLNHNSSPQAYVVQKLRRTPMNIVFMALTALLVFLLGYMIGYLVYGGQKNPPATAAASVLPFNDNIEIPQETRAAPLMDWDDVKILLADKLSQDKFDSTLSELASSSHRAGSRGDEVLGQKVVDKFKASGMKTWTDQHYIKVQEAPASGFNKVTFKGKEELTQGFLSYSATGTATGAVLYAHYGQEAELTQLRDRNIDVRDRVILVRAGKISYAEKVANAAKMNAKAVLIYPDPADFPMAEDTELFGHVHLGTGDPYTPAFPSFNHTQFPPVQSSGLPSILAQTITARAANNIMRQLNGQTLREWGGIFKLGNESDIITVEVNNVLVERKIINVFGVIEGLVDADRYVVIGAHRDAWGPGFASSTIGTSALVELARSISEMVKKDKFKPRRSIVFASWSGGEYGSVGATEWLEGYLSSLSMKAFTYIDLDGIVTGQTAFKVAASPLLNKLVQTTLREVSSPSNPADTLLSQYGKSDWAKKVMEPMTMDSAAFTFQAFSGIPAVSFRFCSLQSDSQPADYLYSGTMMDTSENLSKATSRQTSKLVVTAAQFAGQMALRLVHDHLLLMDVLKYNTEVQTNVGMINEKVKAIKRLKPELLPATFTMQWLFTASGSFGRAARAIMSDMENSDKEDVEMCRIINDRMMAVERNFLSPYVSPSLSPFRHILLGSGQHTLKALVDHLDAVRTETPQADALRNQFALITWTIQGCANSLAGDIWALDNQI